MITRTIVLRAIPFVAVVTMIALLVFFPATARAGDDVPNESLEWEFLEAETALAQGEPRIAASHYRAAVRTAETLLDALPEENPLRDRLAASLVHAYRNLAALQRQTGFERGVAALETAAAETAARYPRAREPLGRIDVDAGATPPSIRPPELDPVALLASEPASLRAAIELLDAGEPDAAEAELRRRLDGPDGARARALLGRFLASQGRRAEAETELLTAVETDPGLAAAHQTLARLYWLDDRRSDAVRHLRRAARLGPLERDLALALARLERDAGRSAAAERQLVSLDKRFGSVEALLELNDLARRAGDEKRALEAAERARQLAPHSEEVLLIHVRQALMAGVVASAQRSIEPLVRMRPEVAEYRFLLGETWRQRRDMGEAVEAYLKAIELDPDYLAVFLPLALALNHESRYAEATGYLERHLETHPGDLAALAALAEAEARLGDPDAAERRARSVIERDGGHARAWLVLGMTAAGRGDFAAAAEALRRAVDADPRLAKAHYQLSLACARLGDRGCAAEHLALYKKALEGPEASYVQLETAEPAPMRKTDESEDGGEP